MGRGLVPGRAPGGRERLGQLRQGEYVGQVWSSVQHGSPAPDVVRPTVATGSRGGSLGPFT